MSVSINTYGKIRHQEEFYTGCRHKLKHRKRPVGKHVPIKNRVCIEQRPAEANGKRFGDWEMDLIIGKGNRDAMLTLAERSTGSTLQKDQTLAYIIIKKSKIYNTKLMRDQGKN